MGRVGPPGGAVAPSFDRLQLLSYFSIHLDHRLLGSWLTWVWLNQNLQRDIDFFKVPSVCLRAKVCAPACGGLRTNSGVVPQVLPTFCLREIVLLTWNFPKLSRTVEQEIRLSLPRVSLRL